MALVGGGSFIYRANPVYFFNYSFGVIIYIMLPRTHKGSYKCEMVLHQFNLKISLNITYICLSNP